MEYDPRTAFPRRMKHLITYATAAFVSLSGPCVGRSDDGDFRRERFSRGEERSYRHLREADRDKVEMMQRIAVALEDIRFELDELKNLEMKRQGLPGDDCP